MWRLDPDPQVAHVAEPAVQRAHALDHHDSLGSHHPLVRERLLPVPVEAAVAGRLTPGERPEHLALEPRELELGAVPELVRGDHLCVLDRGGERRLTGAAAATDADEGHSAARAESPDTLLRGRGVHRHDATLWAMAKLRLGGMALSNGVLVHGPTAWACAIRLPDGRIKVASAPKSRFAAHVQQPVLRGPARLAEAFALLPQVRRRLPEARFAFERPAVIAATLASGFVAQSVRRSRRLGGLAQELVAGAVSLAPAALALSGGELAAYHGAEHVSIGSYEHGGRATKEHERCGTHLVGPLLAALAAGNVLAAAAPARLRRPARLAATVGAVGAAVEVFSWMNRHSGHPLARALARPGHELQSRVATAEPSPEQLEVANAALAACLELEA